MMLDALRLAVIEEGYSDVTFIIVKMKGWRSTYYSYLLTSRVSFPVYQDTEALNIWSLLDGSKDDILVYDRCGQLTYHIRLPYSNLRYSIVEQAIKITAAGNDPCICATDEMNTATMTSAFEEATTAYTMMTYINYINSCCSLNPITWINDHTITIRIFGL